MGSYLDLHRQICGKGILISCEFLIPNLKKIAKKIKIPNALQYPYMGAKQIQWKTRLKFKYKKITNKISEGIVIYVLWENVNLHRQVIPQKV